MAEASTGCCHLCTQHALVTFHLKLEQKAILYFYLNGREKVDLTTVGGPCSDMTGGSESHQAHFRACTA